MALRPRPAICVLALCALAQDADPIRVTTTLVQVDAIVTNRGGQPVTDLTRDDFQIFEDGKPRDIRSFSFVRISAPNAATPTRTSTAAPAAPRLQREEVRRTVAVVVDDLKMSFESLHYTREALRKFIATQIAPGDLVAILTTSGAAGPLQQFTTEKALLRAAVDRIRTNLTGGGPATAVQAIGGGEGDDGQVAGMLRRRFAVGTLGAVRHIAEGMRDMPGRKSVVLFSEGMRMQRNMVREEPPVDVNEVRRVSDSANRSAVVIYAIDPRGVVYPGLQAKDDVSNLEQSDVVDQMKERLEKLRGTQQTLGFLAAETGGLAKLNNNGMTGMLQQILDDQSGYYLLGFQPGEDAAERLKKEGKYHRLEVKLKRPGLEVRYRKGFLGDNGAPAPTPRTGPERLLAALQSPFAQSGVPLRFTPVFAAGERNQSVIRALLHIDGGAITFGPPDAKGDRAAMVQLIAVTEGETKASTEKSYTIRVPREALARLAKGGFVYTLEHTIKKPGPYQMRVAVLDVGSGRTGSASRFVEVPEIARGAPALSGISMADGDWRQKRDAEDDLSPAVRIFQRGHIFSYGVTVFNGRSVELHPRLVRGEQVVWEGKPIPVVAQPGLDPRRLPAGGVLTLSEKTTPGEYILELRAIDTATRRPLAPQWIDFELR